MPKPTIDNVTADFFGPVPTETSEKNLSQFKFENEGGPLTLPDPATPNGKRPDLLPSPQNTWRDLLKELNHTSAERINDLLLELNESGHLSMYADGDIEHLRVARAVHQCENVERMAVERFNQLLECARRIVRPRATSPDFEYHRYRDPTLFINDLKLVEGDLKLLDAMGKTLRNRLITGYLISQSSFDFKAIDLIGSPTGGFDDDEMEFIRLLSVPYKAFAPLLAAQMETIIENIGVVDRRYYETISIPDYDDCGAVWNDTYVTVKDKPYTIPPLSDIRFNLDVGLL